MLKKSVLGLGFFVTLAAPFVAVHAENNGSGCGLGQMILEGKSGMGPNIGAAIINNIIFPQTFAMSTGTMGCDTTQTVKREEEREVFVAQNIDNLSVDMAQGQGDYLASLAKIMGIEGQDKDVFYRLTQEQYSNIINTNTAHEMLAQIDSAMVSDGSLAKYIQ